MVVVSPICAIYTGMSVQRQVTAGAGGVYDLGFHLVWCPKYRRAVLTGDIAVRCEELLREKASARGWEFIALEVMPDHIHAFITTTPKDSPAFVANQLKGYTSRHLREEFPSLKSRLPTLWSRSYYAASVGAVSAKNVQRYIDSQWDRPWRKAKAS